MKRVLLGGMMMLSATALVGCGNQVSKSIQQSVEDNKNATSYMEWETSPNHPEVLFKQWRDDMMMDSERQAQLSAEICKELNLLEGEKLTLFDNDIRDEANRALLNDCKDELLEKIEKYYEGQRATLSVPVNPMSLTGSRNAFKFADNVQYRDTTNGYYAISGDVGRKEVVITFDDGPSGVYTDSILRSLKEVNAKGIFFLLGRNVRSNPEIVKRVAADGHAVGSHSMTHACLGNSVACRKTNGKNLTLEEASAEIRGAHQAVYDTLGFVDPFFRFPYGESSPELKNFLRQNSVGDFFWAIDSEDWKAQSNETLLRNTISRIEARGRGVVLFHDIQRRTAEIMPEFLKELHKRGYSIVLLQSSDAKARTNSKLVKKRLP